MERDFLCGSCTLKYVLVVRTAPYFTGMSSASIQTPPRFAATQVAAKIPSLKRRGNEYTNDTRSNKFSIAKNFPSFSRRGAQAAERRAGWCKALL